ncbi:phosphoribosylglycinamide formyltransferase 1 [uncultured Pleomorphomonas sp.]|uniref:Phosphoribosylglycinamide formyltransferase n=1 Tax=uncultured Pleomorphomonas sp. TaxID=442121 RepID=A0A212LED9_9HYPH|nr:phosphoribosylglycinamide formyltransferase [uncultured Pleomorphomonas sp.]SCM75739.1 phosphoribosylglycinamide formyltransferase 1 [uncultured Pleomorphomonas sp.]
MGKLKVGILISGRGSNMAALVEAAQDPAFPAEICCVLSNRPDAKGLDFARARGIPAVVVDHKAHASKAEFEAAVTDALVAHGVDFVCLAGFMRIVSPAFIERWHNRLINIHPSLLPSYKGLHTHERALADGVKLAGCTVHFVRAEMDAGPIIAQAAVPVVAGDTPDSLAARILTAEHRLYPLAVRLIAEGKAKITGERVEIAPGAVDETARLFSAA